MPALKCCAVSFRDSPGTIGRQVLTVCPFFVAPLGGERASASKDARTSRRDATRGRGVDREHGSELRSDGLVDDKPRFDEDKHRFEPRTCVLVAPGERSDASARIPVALSSTSELRAAPSGARTRPNEGRIEGRELRIRRSVRPSVATSRGRRRERRNRLAERTNKLAERTRELRMGGTLAGSPRPNLRL